MNNSILSNCSTFSAAFMKSAVENSLLSANDFYIYYACTFLVNLSIPKGCIRLSFCLYSFS